MIMSGTLNDSVLLGFPYEPAGLLPESEQTSNERAVRGEAAL